MLKHEFDSDKTVSFKKVNIIKKHEYESVDSNTQNNNCELTLNSNDTTKSQTM